VAACGASYHTSVTLSGSAAEVTLRWKVIDEVDVTSTPTTSS
jgi:hypothetical protein